jgi:hypothetical protein
MTSITAVRHPLSINNCLQTADDGTVGPFGLRAANRLELAHIFVTITGLPFASSFGLVAPDVSSISDTCTSSYNASVKDHVETLGAAWTNATAKSAPSKTRITTV